MGWKGSAAALRTGSQCVYSAAIRLPAKGAGSGRAAWPSLLLPPGGAKRGTSEVLCTKRMSPLAFGCSKAFN